MESKIKKIIAMLMAIVMFLSTIMVNAAYENDAFAVVPQRESSQRVESIYFGEGYIKLENTMGINSELFESFERFIETRQHNNGYIEIQGFSDTIYLDARIMAIQFEALKALDTMGVRNVNDWLDETYVDILPGQYAIIFDVETRKTSLHIMNDYMTLIEEDYQINMEIVAIRHALLAPRV